MLNKKKIYKQTQKIHIKGIKKENEKRLILIKNYTGFIMRSVPQVDDNNAPEIKELL